jgi:hypothetical protein
MSDRTRVRLVDRNSIVHAWSPHTRNPEEIAKTIWIPRAIKGVSHPVDSTTWYVQPNYALLAPAPLRA